jgi:3-hydroxyacyl-CoA dehydrogenase/enoyl-CoA hydratase/3-hydroxybutyryl-CoA epimerase
MLAEGNNPRAIEAAGLQAGMPVGPLALTDEVSLSLIAHIRKQTAEDLKAEGKAIPTHPANEVVDKMVDSLKRLGKAAGGGFYEYPKDGKKHLWPGLAEAFPHKTDLDQTEMIQRMMFIQCIETVRCMEEGVLTSVPDGNIGSIFGWGFAPFKGGTLQYINDYGFAEFIATAKKLQAKYGDRFAVPAMLESMAKDGKEF